MAARKRSFIPKFFFTKEEKARIAQSIQNAEAQTTGEIRIRVERRCPAEPLDHARSLLETLGLTATRDRTGVLIYFSLSDRKLAIYGDIAIHNHFGNEGWQKVLNQLSARFSKEEFVEGLCEAIDEMGSVLSKAFPARSDDLNELSDKPSYEE